MRSTKPRLLVQLVLLALTLYGVVGGVAPHAQTPTSQTQSPQTQNSQTPNPETLQTPAAPPLSQAQASAPAASRTVRLNVIVTDEANRSVGDLRQEDFRVEEDGAAQTITHFAREKSPVSYMLVMDNSGSLRSLLEYMLRAGSVLVSANQPGDETSLMRFVSSDNISVVQDFTDNQSALMDGLASMYVEGGHTAVIDAVYLSAENVGARRRDEAGRRRALVLLTDGEDRSSHYKQSELQALLRKHDVQVFAVGIVEILANKAGFLSKSSKAKATALLNSLTQETGGRVFFPKSARELQEAVGEIAQDLRTQYTITYQTSNASADGKFRKINVKVSGAGAGGKRIAHTRAGYFAPGAKDEAKNESKEKSPRLKSP